MHLVDWQGEGKGSGCISFHSTTDELKKKLMNKKKGPGLAQFLLFVFKINIVTLQANRI